MITYFFGGIGVINYKNLFNVDSQVVLVTGSQGGLGKAICEGFEENGAFVYGLDKGNGLDLTDYEIIESYIQHVVEKHGKIDTLINCAGVSLENLGDNFQTTLSINLVAMYNIIKEVFDYMERGSSIINITSLAAELGFSGNPGYVASKAGVKGLTKAVLNLGITYKSLWSA